MEVNHVVILIGKTYKVTCDMPFGVIAKSDPSIDAWWEDDRILWLNWPVTISGDDKLFRVSGRSLPVTVAVPPEQRVSFEIVYEGTEPSGSERDIVATATFTEEDNRLLHGANGRKTP